MGLRSWFDIVRLLARLRIGARERCLLLLVVRLDRVVDKLMRRCVGIAVIV